MARMMTSGPIILDPSPKKELAGKYICWGEIKKKIFWGRNTRNHLMDRMGAQRDAFGRPYGSKACKKAPEIRTKSREREAGGNLLCRISPNHTKKKHVDRVPRIELTC